MKIVKYILLLFIFLSIAFIVFIATQKGNFKISKSKEINAPQEVALNLISNSASFSNWSAQQSENVSINKINLVSNDSINCNLDINGENSESLFYFKKTNNKVYITWELNGVLNFKLKILNLINGGLNSTIGFKMENSLKNINTYLDKELNTFNIKIDGFTQFKKTNFIQQTDTCNQEEFQKKSKFLLQNMIGFVKKNNIKTTGSPFILYENGFLNKKTIIFSMCVPVVEEILTKPGSEISGGNLQDFSAVKATLIGDYSHRKEILKKVKKYAIKNNFIEDSSNGKYIEIYKLSIPKEQKPSKWITEIYYPVIKKPNEVNSNEIEGTKNQY